MKKINSVIEVNGNRYNAATGQLLNPTKKGHRQSSKKLVDSFVLNEHNKPIRKTVARLHKSKSRAKSASQALHRSAERSRTLMRQAVKKPAGLKPNKTSDRSTPNHVKQLRAKTAIKHDKVERFGYFPQPRLKSSNNGASHRSEQSRAGGQGSLTLPPRLPSMVTSASHRQIEKMLDEALIKADAHRLMMNRRPKRGLVPSLPGRAGLGVIVIFLAVLAALFIWQHFPAVAVHVATVNP